MRTTPARAALHSGSIAMLAATLALAAPAGFAEVPPRRPVPAPTLPAEVSAAVAKDLAKAGAPGNATRPQALAFAERLSGTRHPDWVVDYSRAPSGRHCGTGGCPLKIWSRADGARYRPVFDRQVLSYRIDHSAADAPALEVELHGTLCGGTGSESCSYRFAWRSAASGRDGRFEAVGRTGQATRYAGPLAQAMPVAAPGGSVIAAARKEYSASCARVGGVADLSDAIVRLPDLNGDGRAEILFDAAFASCDKRGETVEPDCRDGGCATRLFVHGENGWRTAWSSGPVAYDITISDRVATLVVRSAECERRREGSCAGRPLHWDATTRRFTEAAAGDLARR
jgi:hypothetical protein